MNAAKGKSKRGRRPTERESSDTNKEVAEKEEENSEDQDGKASSLAEDEEQALQQYENEAAENHQKKLNGGKKWSPPRYNQNILEYVKDRKPNAVSIRPSRRFVGRSNVLNRIRMSQDQKRDWPSGNRPNSLSPILGLKELDSSLRDLLPEESFFTEGDLINSDVAARILKAKVNVLQEELHQLIQESVEKDERIKQLEEILKEVEQERARLQKDFSIKQMQADKYQHLADDARNKLDDLEAENISLRKLIYFFKEVEILRHGQKQAVAIKGTTESRLHRTLEEMDRLRTELKQARQEYKSHSDLEKKKIEEVMAENRQMEKQKSELLNAFKKQMKLIDVLKKQKMHLEASKALNFTEEEFMRALDWGS
ncbi:testis-expressed protein 9-like isoform X2 [Centruroides sculpturatus]|uniref:testis-expressed protein 9-like isoform X2 n=1 Tax=Centruroides sculpturatus TaxID=218467 RepID=UPI000C6EA805|nr:testis-expressed protein 9-like isoform X2 [Centruroides sculpturatus]